MNICLNCGSEKYYGKGYCKKCYNKIIDHPKWIHNRILFKGKRITLKANPRIGICSLCGKEGKTDIHHLKYHKDNPLKDTIEICDSCHCKQHERVIDITTGRFLKLK